MREAFLQRYENVLDWPVLMICVLVRQTGDGEDMSWNVCMPFSPLCGLSSTLGDMESIII